MNTDKIITFVSKNSFLKYYFYFTMPQEIRDKLSEEYLVGLVGGSKQYEHIQKHFDQLKTKFLADL